MGNRTRPRPFLDSARRPRKQGNGVANPRIIRLTVSDVVAAPDAHPNSHPPRQRLGDAAWTLDKNASISEVLRENALADLDGSGVELCPCAFVEST